MKIGMAIGLIKLGAKLKRKNSSFFVTSLSSSGVVVRGIMGNTENPIIPLEDVYVPTDYQYSLRLADCFVAHYKDKEAVVWLPTSEDLFADDWEIAETLILSAFPGTGKTVLTGYKGLNILDSDSSKFDKSEFPQNYIKHIKEKVTLHSFSNPIETPLSVDILCISSHKSVREELESQRIPYTLVYPYTESKDEYLGRYKKRGSSDTFISLLNDNWRAWIKDCCSQKRCAHYRLLPQQYLSDAVGLSVLDIGKLDNGTGV